MVSELHKTIIELEDHYHLKQATISPETLIFEDSDLNPNGYDLGLMFETKRDPRKIYLKSTTEGLQYEVIGLDGALKQNTIPWDKLPKDFPRDPAYIVSSQVDWTQILLDYTSKEGHTHPNNGSINDEAKKQLREFKFIDTQIADLDTKAKIIHGLKQKVTECLQNPLASAAEKKHLEELNTKLNCTDSLSGRLKDFYKTLQKPPEIEFSEKAGRFFSYCKAFFTNKITGKEFLDYFRAKEEHIIASKVFKSDLTEIAAAQEFKAKFAAYSTDPAKIDEAVRDLKVRMDDKSLSLSEMQAFFDEKGMVQDDFKAKSGTKPNSTQVVGIVLNKANDLLAQYEIKTEGLSDRQKIAVYALIIKVNIEVAEKHKLVTSETPAAKPSAHPRDLFDVSPKTDIASKALSSRFDAVKKLLKEFTVTDIAPEQKPEVQQTPAPR